MKFYEEDYTKLDNLFRSSDISSCTKEELERYAVMLSRPRANVHFPKSSFSQICETVRTLILVRISEESNKQARKESRIALIIAIVALVATVIQSCLAVYSALSRGSVEVYTAQPIETRSVTILPGIPSQKKTSPITNTQQ